MEEMTKHGRIGVAAMRAGMDRKTARKYVAEGKLPSELFFPTVHVHDGRVHETAVFDRQLYRQTDTEPEGCERIRSTDRVVGVAPLSGRSARSG